MRVTFDGRLGDGVYAKDMILALIGKIGAQGGIGYATEFAGAAVRALPIEGRLTHLQHVDRVLRASTASCRPTTRPSSTSRAASSRPRAPRGTQAVAYWRTLRTDDGRARSTARCTIDCDALGAAGHLGHQPAAGDLDRRTRARSGRGRGQRARSWRRALGYMRLEPGTPLAGLADRRRLHRLVHQRAAVGPARGRRGAEGPQGASRACRRSAFRDRRRSSTPPRPRGSTASSRRRASSGTSRRAASAAASATTASPTCASSAPPTATSRAARARRRARTSRARPRWRPRRSPGCIADADGGFADGSACARSPASPRRCCASTSTPTRSSRRSSSAAPTRRATASTSSTTGATCADGSPNPEFILNQPPYDHAEVLLADRNFGCGSSRERAPKALREFGFRAVIAPSFGGIFFNNCYRNGIVPVELPIEHVREIGVARSKPPAARGTVTVDLEAQTVTSPSGRDAIAFTAPEHPAADAAAGRGRDRADAVAAARRSTPSGRRTGCAEAGPIRKLGVSCCRKSTVTGSPLASYSAYSALSRSAPRWSPLRQVRR